MPVIQMQHDVDPRKALLDKLGDISGIEVWNDRVLLAIYIHDGKTKGGIITSVTTQTEGKYQGKVGLVLKVGPLCEPKAEVRGADIHVGDWVVVNPSDGLSMHAGKHGSDVQVRMVAESSIHMRVQSPDAVW